MTDIKGNLSVNSDDTPYILQICHCYYDPFLDCARQFSAIFKGTKYRIVTVFMTGEPDDAVAKAADSDEVIFLGHSSKKLRGLKLQVIREIHQIAKQYPFEFCIAHRAKSAYVGLLATKLPIYSIRHSFGDFDRTSRRWMINRFRHRVKILAVSNAVRDEIRLHLAGWPAEQIVTFYNHIDVEKVRSELLSRTQAREALKLPESAWIIGSVGRLHPDKDPKTLIHGFALALEKLPEKSLLAMIGTGRLENELKKLVHSLGIEKNVLFLGRVSVARQYFKAFDCFVLASDHEPFGMVLLEAMAANLPIICSDCGGAPEVVGDTGLLFELGNAVALADAIANLATSEKQIEYLIEERLENYFSDTSAKNSFFKQILKLDQP
jgi:glycosyltransferase involved in cell wall biosynthesis